MCCLINESRKVAGTGCLSGRGNRFLHQIVGSTEVGIGRVEDINSLPGKRLENTMEPMIKLSQLSAKFFAVGSVYIGTGGIKADKCFTDGYGHLPDQAWVQPDVRVRAAGVTRFSMNEFDAGTQVDNCQFRCVVLQF